MKFRFSYFLACAALLVFVSACSQSDGPLPVANGDVPNRLGDLSKDLLHVAGGDREAPKDLADDLAVFVDHPAEPAARALADRTAAALQKSKLTEPIADKLANQLWITVAGTQLSQHQQKRLQEDAKTELTSVGASAESAQAAADAMANVQKIVNTRKRRWYEFR